jgi:hypothetical protein
MTSGAMYQGVPARVSVRGLSPACNEAVSACDSGERERGREEGRERERGRERD